VKKLPWMAHLAGAKAPVFFYEKIPKKIFATENITASV
jgi:hypothetical protein